jgi:hypothetical protein
MVVASFGESHRLESSGLEIYTGTPKQHGSLQDAQKVLPARPQPKNRPQAYPLGYVEDLFEVRTKLEDFFSILLEISAITVPNLPRYILELRQM